MADCLVARTRQLVQWPGPQEAARRQAGDHRLHTSDGGNLEAQLLAEIFDPRKIAVSTRSLTLDWHSERSRLEGYKLEVTESHQKTKERRAERGDKKILQEKKGGEMRGEERRGKEKRAERGEEKIRQEKKGGEMRGEERKGKVR
eukprot:Skav235438  [mRNA]  locus=scaffold774:102835:107157:+ [translate_table: standard]